MNKAKRGWMSRVSCLALPIALVLPVVLVGQTPFEVPCPEAGRTPNAQSNIPGGWFLGQRTVLRQSTLAPYPDTLILVGSYEAPGKAQDVWVEYPLAYLAGDHIGYDSVGRLIKELVNEETEPGACSVSWDGRDLSGNEAPSAVYFCRLSSGSQTESRKMVLLRSNTRCQSMDV